MIIKKTLHDWFNSDNGSMLDSNTLIYKIHNFEKKKVVKRNTTVYTCIYY